MSARRFILAVTGLAAEARIARGKGAIAVSGGGDRLALESKIDEAIANGVSAIVSFGIAGGIDASLAPGVCVVARSVIDENAVWPVDAAWSDAIAARLRHAARGDIVGVDRVFTDVASKRACYVRTGAATVDMESHIAAKAAQTHALPFAAIRVVSDPGLRALPASAASALRTDGSVDVMRVLKSVLADPAQLPLLLRAGIDAGTAFRALRRSRRRLGDAFDFPDLDQLALDVP